MENFFFDVTNIGFTQKCDPSLFVHNNGKEKVIVIVIIHVENLLITGDDSMFIFEFSKRMEIKFEGELHWLLGMKITRNKPKESSTLSQPTFFDQTLERFSMKNCKGVSTSGLKTKAEMCPANQKEKSEMKEIPYR